MIIEILFSEVKDITKLYKNKEVDNSGFEVITEREYLGKEYSEKVLADVVDGFEGEKSICYVGCLQRIANEVFDFYLLESKYRVSFTIDTYEDNSNKARLKVKLEQVEPREEYDMLLEQLKIAIKDRLIRDWNRCIWMTDEQSEALCTMIYPIVFTTENEMRALVNKVLIHSIGVDWIKRIGMEKYDLSYENLVGDFRRISPQYGGVDDTFFSMTLETMMEIIKKGKIYDENVTISSADWKALNEKKNKSADAVLGYIQKKRKVNMDIWKDIFEQYFDFELSVITDFIKNRNHIAHNKLLNWVSMQKIKQNVELLKSYIEIVDQKFEESAPSEERYMTIDVQQELERDWEEDYLRDRIQEVTGVEILTMDGVLEKFNELLDELYNEIYDELYFNPCFNISQQYVIEEETNEQILFKVQSNAVKESEIEVVVSLWLSGDMDSDSSAIISCRKTDETDKYLFKAEIRYHNGSGYEDYDLGGIYLDSQSELDDSELNDFKKELIVYTEEKLNPMVEKIAAYNRANKKPVSDEACYECDKKGISVMKDFYPEGFCCFCGTDNNE